MQLKPKKIPKINAISACNWLESGEFHLDISMDGLRLVGHPCCFAWITEAALTANSLPLEEAVALCRDGQAWELVSTMYSRATQLFQGDGYCKQPRLCSSGPRLVNAADVPKSPRHLVLSTSRGCNLSCPMCRKSFMGLQPLEVELTQHLLDGIKGKGLESVSTTLLGEPFLLPMLQRWMKELRPEDTKLVHVLTNGGLLTEASLRLLNEAMTANGVRLELTLSIDGTTGEVHEASRPGSSFEQVMGIAAVAKELGVLRAINYVLQPVNCHELARVRHFFIEEQNLVEPSLIIYRGDFEDSASLKLLQSLNAEQLRETLKFNRIYNVSKMLIYSTLLGKENENSLNNNIT